MTRGPYTFRGYFNSPEHNASAFDANGFYCSGDLISIDDAGYITVQGREKDQINRGGEKIAAEEIENLLLRHEAVIHAALVSMEDSLLGEKAARIWWSNIRYGRWRSVVSCVNKVWRISNYRTALNARRHCR